MEQEQSGKIEDTVISEQIGGSSPSPNTVIDEQKGNSSRLSDTATNQQIGGSSPPPWETKYKEISAKYQIWFEAIYLAVLLFSCPILMLWFWSGYPGGMLGLKDHSSVAFIKYSLAWFGGTLGGTLFSIKWLYHSVASYEWYKDRLYWRIFTPHLSGALSFSIIMLISSGILQIFNKTALDIPSTVAGLSFLSGYFSDNAIAKMTEVANTMFGTLQKSQKKNQNNGNKQSTDETT